MQVLKNIENFIYESPTWKLITTVLLIMLFKTGVWYIPNMEISRIIAQYPFINSFKDPSNYLFWNWLGLFLSWVVGAEGQCLFFLFHFIFSIAFTFLFIKMLFVHFSNRDARTSLILFLLLPVSATAYFWVGTDSITLFLMLCAFVFSGFWFITLLTGVALGMQHFEQAFCAFLGLFLAISISKHFRAQIKYSTKWALTLLIGVILGKLFLMGIFDYFDMNVSSGRISWLKSHFLSMLNQFFFHIHYILWSILGLGWIIVLKYSEKGKIALPFLLCLFGFMILLPVCEDQTRVFAIISFPLIAAFWLFNCEFIDSLSNQLISWLFLLWIIIPWGWVWQGRPKWSVFPHDIAYFLSQLFGWSFVPANPALWPFF
ncbi:MAG: hypothetical protein ABH870_01875 [bacterium]